MHRTEMSAPLTEVVDRHPPADFLPPEPSSSARLLSLDVFRGLCVAGMILVDNPGNDDAAYWPIKHAEWRAEYSAVWRSLLVEWIHYANRAVRLTSI